MHTILVAVDLSPFTEGVVDVAGAIAAATGAKLHLVHAIPPPTGFEALPRSGAEIDAMLAREETDVLDRLGALAERLAGQGAEVESMTCMRGEPADEIVARSAELAADLVVIGANAKGPLVSTLLGNVSASVLRSAGRPVLVVPARRPDEPAPAAQARENGDAS